MDNSYESTQSNSVDLLVTATDGGEFYINGLHNITEKKYIIKKLNCRIWLNKKGDTMKDIFMAQSEICSSKKDIEIFRYLLVHTSGEHRITRSAIKIAEDNGVNRDKIYKFIKKATTQRILYKEGTNIYFVNPFMFTPIGAKAKTIQDAQFEWHDIMFKKDLKDPDKSGILLEAIKMAEEFNLSHSVPYLLENSFFQSILQQYTDGKKLSSKQIDGLGKIR